MTDEYKVQAVINALALRVGARVKIRDGLIIFSSTVRGPVRGAGTVARQSKDTKYWYVDWDCGAINGPYGDYELEVL